MKRILNSSFCPLPFMRFDLQKIIESKRALHRKLATLPVAEKLRMLDALRERELAIRNRAVHSDSRGIREASAPYPTKPK